RWQFCDDPESDPYVWTSGDVRGRLDGDGRGWSHLDLYGFRGRQCASCGDREGLDERPQRRRDADVHRLRGRRDGTLHVRVDVRGRRHRQHTESDPRVYGRRHVHGDPEGDGFGRRLLDLDPNRCGGSSGRRGGFHVWHLLLLKPLRRLCRYTQYIIKPVVALTLERYRLEYRLRPTDACSRHG